MLKISKLISLWDWLISCWRILWSSYEVGIGMRNGLRTHPGISIEPFIDCETCDYDGTTDIHNLPFRKAQQVCQRAQTKKHKQWWQKYGGGPTICLELKFHAMWETLQNWERKGESWMGWGDPQADEGIARLKVFQILRSSWSCTSRASVCAIEDDLYSEMRSYRQKGWLYSKWKKPNLGKKILIWALQIVRIPKLSPPDCQWLISPNLGWFFRIWNPDKGLTQYGNLFLDT